MQFFKRIFLFVVVNLAVVLTISFLLKLLNVQPYLQKHGLDYTSLAIFCFIWGMVGAFISLLLSRWMAKTMMRVQVIDPNTHDSALKKLRDTVYRLCKKANLSAMPEVGIFPSPEINAFATGPSAKRSLIAVSSGLLDKMGEQEIEGVIAHEISHIANGDMVTMTLLQGVVNAFVMFLARALAFALSGIGGRHQKQNASSSHMGYFVMVMLFELVFMVLGSLVIAAFSRYREFRADRGGARLAGKNAMISALESLQRFSMIKNPQEEPTPIAALKISTPGKSSWLSLFASHPPLKERILRLQSL